MGQEPVASVVDAFERAYVATSYTAQTPDGALVLRVGARNDALDAVLRQHGARSCAFVTACNPGSQLTDEARNRAAGAELGAMVSARGLVAFAGVAASDDGRWPAEPSLLVLGLDQDDALELGRRFGQNAVVWSELGHAPELLWCN